MEHWVTCCSAGRSPGHLSRLFPTGPHPPRAPHRSGRAALPGPERAGETPGTRRTRGPDRRRSTRDRGEHCRAQGATQRRRQGRRHRHRAGGADAAPAQEGSGTTGTAGTTRSKRAASTGRTGKATGTTGGTRAKQTAAKPRATKKAAATTAAPAAGTGTAAEEHQLVQLLTPEGKRVKNAEYDPYVADLTPEDLRGLYRDMVLTRRFDAEATSLQRQGELGLWASLLGQEAAQIGSGRATRPDDYVFPTYREHGVAWCRGSTRPTCSACSAA